MTKRTTIYWPKRYRIWQKLHGFFNRMAWKYNDPGGPDWGKALRIDKTRLWWRLNDWASSHYLPWWIKQTTGHELPKETKK